MSPLPPSIIDDVKRLAILDSYAVLDTSAEPGFDDIVHLVCRLCDVPVSLVSLVAGDRQWFKARIGFEPCQTDLDSSVCAHALAQPDQILVIPDLTVDPRTQNNPLVTGEPRIRFYAGAPLVTSDGHVLGSLCAIDVAPRSAGLTDAQAIDLKALARQVMSQLELRRAIAVRDQSDAVTANIYRIREILRRTQGVDGDLGAVLQAIVAGAMQALPAAEGGVVELLVGNELEYRAVAGTLLPHKGLRFALKGSLAGHCVETKRGLLVDDEMADSRLQSDVIRQIGQSAAVFAPVMHGGRVLGVVKLQSSKRAAFTERDLQVLELFANTATIGLAEAAFRVEVQARDIYWRDLFSRLDECFLIAEIVRDPTGEPTDWRYVEANPAWGKMLGVEPTSVVGRTVRDVSPEIDDAWVDDFLEVVATGQSSTFTRQFGSRSWYEGRAFKLDGDRFGVTFLDVTSRHEAELRRTALLALGDRLRDLTSVPAMTQAAAEIVGRTIKASRACFGHIVGDVEFIDIEPDWTVPGVVSIAGRHRFDEFGAIREHLRQGRPLIINDVTSDMRTQPNLSPWQAINTGSMVNMPVRERGRTVAVFIVHDTQARHWSTDELAFLRNVADRVEVGVARVRAEDLQTVLNNELAHRLKNTLSIVQTIARQTLRGVSERELVDALENRILALARAHDVLLQKSWSAARMKAVMEGVLTMQADLDRFALDGPDLDISPQAALSLSLLLHELATNALKYGALSVDNGSVRIAWRTEDGAAPTLILDWEEDGGPPVIAPTNRAGFGSTLIRMGLMGTRKSELTYRRKGLHAEFRAPLRQMQAMAH